MEYGYWPEQQIVQEIKKSKKIILLSTTILFFIFSIGIVLYIIGFDKKEFLVVDEKLDTVESKINNLTHKHVETQLSINNLDKKIDNTFDFSKKTNSKLDLLNEKLSTVSESLKELTNKSKK